MRGCGAVHHQDPLSGQINATFQQTQYLLRLLYGIADPDDRNLVVNQLWNQVSFLQFLFGLVSQRAPQPAAPYAPGGAPVPAPPSAAAPGRAPAPTPTGVPPSTFTRDELARYTGRNGAPAYVAVNGTVYDVTDNHAWSLATHFGLAAGRDLTPEFASCHSGQQWILGTLRPVGRLL